MQTTMNRGTLTLGGIAVTSAAMTSGSPSQGTAAASAATETTTNNETHVKPAPVVSVPPPVKKAKTTLSAFKNLDDTEAKKKAANDARNQRHQRFGQAFKLVVETAAAAKAAQSREETKQLRQKATAVAKEEIQNLFADLKTDLSQVEVIWTFQKANDMAWKHARDMFGEIRTAMETEAENRNFRGAKLSQLNKVAQEVARGISEQNKFEAVMKQRNLDKRRRQATNGHKRSGNPHPNKNGGRKQRGQQK